MSTQFRWLKRTDYPRVLEIVHDIWEGDDYVPQVFNKWVQETGSYVRGLFVDNELVGFSRLKILSDKIGWLQGLRVDPREQGKGYGREIAERMVEFSFSQGLEELYFSTYFGNISSIKIHERMGFCRIGAFTNLSKSVRAPADITHARVLRIDPLLQVPDSGFWNGWTYFPAGTDFALRFLPGGLVLTDGQTGDRLVLARNLEFGILSEISTIDSKSGLVSLDILDLAESICFNCGSDSLNAMVPRNISISPFIDRGFSFYEQENDVFLYLLRRR